MALGLVFITHATAQGDSTHHLQADSLIQQNKTTNRNELANVNREIKKVQSPQQNNIDCSSIQATTININTIKNSFLICMD